MSGQDPAENNSKQVVLTPIFTDRQLIFIVGKSPLITNRMYDQDIFKQASNEASMDAPKERPSSEQRYNQSLHVIDVNYEYVDEEGESRKGFYGFPSAAFDKSYTDTAIFLKKEGLNISKRELAAAIHNLPFGIFGDLIPLYTSNSVKNCWNYYNQTLSNKNPAELATNEEQEMLKRLIPSSY